MKRKRKLPAALTVLVLAGALVFAALASAHWVGKSVISDGSWKIVHCCLTNSSGQAGYAIKRTSGPAGNYRGGYKEWDGTVTCQTGVFNDLNVVHKVLCNNHPAPPPGQTDSLVVVAVADGATRGFYMYDCIFPDCSDVP